MKKKGGSFGKIIIIFQKSGINLGKIIIIFQFISFISTNIPIKSYFFNKKHLNVNIISIKMKYDVSM